MVKELEISVQVLCDYDNLHKELIDNKFEIKQEYIVNDNYMIDSNIDIKLLSDLEVLSKCILVRDVVGFEKLLLYKHKKYDNAGNILEQGKVKCPVLDTRKAIDFMNRINYRTLFEINDRCIVYANEETELVVQLVNDKYIFIEMENKAEFINKEYFDIEEMKKELEKYNLPYDRNNYFVKKAEIMISNARQ